MGENFEPKRVKLYILKTNMLLDGKIWSKVKTCWNVVATKNLVSKSIC